VPAAEVLVVVPFTEPPTATAVTVGAIIRQIRQPQCDRMNTADADALVVAMTDGLDGISVMPPHPGEA
jgi:hypothetical protein